MFYGLREASAQSRIARSIALGDPIALAIPAAWRRLLRSSGVRIDEGRSVIAFARRTLAWMRMGVRTYMALLRASVSAPPAPRASFVAAIDLTPDLAPPSGDEDPGRRDHVNWIARWSERATGARYVWAHVAARPAWAGARMTIAPTPFPRLTSTQSRIAFAVRGALELARTAVALVIGRWWSAALLQERIALSYFTRLPAGSIASAYVFNNSDWLIRPLWTYAAERRGRRVVMTYYSSNNLRFAPGMPPGPAFGCGEGLGTWPEYVVISRDIAESLEAQRGVAIRYEVDPLIDMVDSGATLAIDAIRPVGVFNVTPFRDCALAERGVLTPYYTADRAIAFLTDVQWACAELGATLVMKQKRDIGRLEHRRYSRYADRLSRSSGIVAVDPGIAASRLIGACAAVISAPFTSPSVIAAAMGVPAVFYDPDASVAAVVTTAHGVDVIGGRAALLDWLASALGRGAEGGARG